MGRNVIKYQVVWLIGTMTGRGKPFDEPSIAQAWADAQNKIYGRGTHWVTGRGKSFDAPEAAQAWADAQNKIYGRGTHWVEIVPTEERRP